MAVFPTTPEPSLGTSEQVTYGLIKSSYDGNYLQVRRNATKSRTVFELKYDTITLAEYDTLKTFFDTNIGTIFTFTHPVSLQEYSVTFSSGELPKTWKTFNTVDTKITLEEI